MQASKTVWLLFVLLPSIVCATEDTQQPSLELLEYLGNWEDVNGNWIDPQLLEPAVMKIAESEDETADKQDNE